MLLKRIAALSAVVFAFAAIATPSSQSYAQEKKEEKKEIKEVKKSEFRDDWPDVEGKVARVLKVDVKKRVVHVEFEGGKKEELTVGKEVEFLGPKGGKTKDIKDDRLVEGKTIKVVHDKEGKVKQIHLSIRKKTD